MGAPQPVQASSVMYYLPPPDLSSGRERSRAVRKNNYVPRVTKLLPEDYFDAGFDVATNEIEVNDSINNVEKEEDFKDEQDVSLTTAINLSPTDTIIVDLSGTSDDYGGYNQFMETEDEFDEDEEEATTDPTDFESKRVESDADSAEGKNEIEVDVEVEVNEVYENVKVKNPNKKRKIYFTPQEKSKEKAEKEEKETLV